MAKNLFSVPIFFILFRETLEAAVIVSVLLALADQLVAGPSDREIQSDIANAKSGATTSTAVSDHLDGTTTTSSTDENGASNRSLQEKRLLRKLRIQIFAGAGVGLCIALAIGAAFIAVFYTKVQDLWSKSEDLWEGIFSLIAAIMIWVMGITMLRMDRAKIKWKIKLQKAFEQNQDIQGYNTQQVKRSKSGRYALFILPMITVLREGLEAVVFLGGVSLGQPAGSIPIAAIVGLLCGLVVGFLLYKSSSRLNMSVFLVASTAFLLLIGAGLMSRSVGFFQMYRYVQLVGADIAESGDGPGSYDVHGNVWHLNCCNPEGNNGWSIFNAILGWTNNATIGTILSYILYWLSCIATLLYMKWSEGRTTFFGRKSAAYHKREARRVEKAISSTDNSGRSEPSYSPLLAEDAKKEPATPGLQAGERSAYNLERA